MKPLGDKMVVVGLQNVQTDCPDIQSPNELGLMRVIKDEVTTALYVVAHDFLQHQPHFRARGGNGYDH